MLIGGVIRAVLKRHREAVVLAARPGGPARSQALMISITDPLVMAEAESQRTVSWQKARSGQCLQSQLASPFFRSGDFAAVT